MVMNATGFGQGQTGNVVKLHALRLRDACLGCADCDGPCQALLQTAQLPDILLSLRDARQ